MKKSGHKQGKTAKTAKTISIGRKIEKNIQAENFLILLQIACFQENITTLCLKKIKKNT